MGKSRAPAARVVKPVSSIFKAINIRQEDVHSEQYTEMRQRQWS
jgi:hypothetical protein